MLWTPRTQDEVKYFMKEGTAIVARYAAEYFDLSRPNMFVNDLKVRVGRNRRGRSWATWRLDREGLAFPKINYNCWAWATGKSTFKDYDWFREDPEIGPIKNATWIQFHTALICHEVAHTIEDIVYDKEKANELYGGIPPKIEKDRRLSSNKRYAKHVWNSHNEVWQEIYRILRNHFVNGKPGLDIDPPRSKRKNKSRLTEKIGKVKIKWGTALYRGRWVFDGTYELVKDFQKHGGTKNYKIGDGFLTIRKVGGERLFRVNVWKNKGYEILKGE